MMHWVSKLGFLRCSLVLAAALLAAQHFHYSQLVDLKQDQINQLSQQLNHQADLLESQSNASSLVQTLDTIFTSPAVHSVASDPLPLQPSRSELPNESQSDLTITTKVTKPQTNLNKIVESLIRDKQVLEKMATRPQGQMHSQLAKQFNLEEVDLQWASSQELSLQDIWAENEVLSNSDLSKIECKSRQCLISVYPSDATDINQITASFYQELSAKQLYTKTHSLIVQPENEFGEISILFTHIDLVENSL
ncbi:MULTISPECIES: hypothetical protein [unclassified Agarivorans]|uniref:hypothetical protein n=1 Tax=unclassified Agarivorans TaxID=2636026 RepID=UPI0026E3381B|nr:MULTISPECIES: hypothetical protein [unclassified Agarivorans]MDO6684563.1 hypothetical protein [Agarivorans sp. 3_MG-2023]MDO6714728.1 hypothetical protein [Agarivorans sp. 2_MG-2023]